MGTGKKKKKEKYIAKLGRSVGVCFLFFFMLLIFSPAETYFANAAELQFIYGEFAFIFIIAAVGCAIVLGLLLSLLPEVFNKAALSFVFSISACCYVQNMFLNKGLDLMGLNPEGYVPETSRIVVNLIIWIVIIAAVMVLSMLVKHVNVAGIGAAFLWAIQCLALVSLFMGADDNCFSYPETEYHLSGAGQYQLGADGNVVMFIMDSFSDGDLYAAMQEKPDALSPFGDFTFYDNEDSVYCGTYPSLIHMFTGNELDFDATVDEWAKESWNTDSCNDFYASVKEAGYSMDMYTPDLNIICGLNPSEELLEGKFTNFTNAPLERIIDRDTIRNTMFRMAAYRMSPTFLKNNFYVHIDEYYDAVKIVDDPMMHENYEFYSALKENGITVVPESKTCKIYHLMGTHLFKNDETGAEKEDATPQETALGCLNIVNEYMDEMKSNNIYDSSTIIVTADHGAGWAQQPIFLIKPAYSDNDSITTSSAPVSHCEIMPTIADAMGIDASKWGQTVYDIGENEARERTLWIYDYSEDYPDVPCYYGDKKGTANVYIGFTYTGNEDDLLKILFTQPTKIIQMKDSYF